MTVQRLLFDVEYADTPEATSREFRVRVTMADRIEAETSGHSYGVLDPAAQPQLLGLVWLYLASTRTGCIPVETTFEEFKGRCLDNSKVEAETVPPTVEESAPSSSSQPGTPALTGSPST